MVVLGAYHVGYPPVEWRAQWPTLIFATLEPPDSWRGARWIRWAQWPLLLLRAWWTLVAEQCQAILVVFPDEIFLSVGYALARLTGKPLYAYFHNTYLENWRDSRLAHWLQPRIFATARHVFVMSEGMHRLYQTNYPGLQCSPLVQSFNESLPDPDDVTLPPMHQPLRLLLFGNINRSCAEAAARIAQLVQVTPDVHLTLLSGTARTYLKKLGFTGDRVTIETVSRDVLLHCLRQADIVLLPHGFHSTIAAEEIATIFPTRTIEALISQRPILAHLPKDCFLAQFLRGHDCALIVNEPDLEALRQAVERLRQNTDLRVHLVRQALIAARQFQASTVAAHLREIMQDEAAVATAKQSMEN
jgi:glycosyltransferase involved in cell wall biosynthesis